MIYYGKQSLDQDDIDAVVKVLKSDLITQGPVARDFESAVAKYVGASYAVACSNGSAALHLACLSLNVVKSDIVWTVPNTYIASANCALYCGAQVDFVDIDPLSLNISIEELKRKLKAAEINGLLPKVLVVVHFAGNSCDMLSINTLSRQYGFYIIEDACHALGSEYRHKKIGCCEFSDISVFSFHPVKSITCGEGGLLLSNDKLMTDQARLLANNGITKDASMWNGHCDEPWYYEQQVVGFNYRITDIQCALGLSQLVRLDEFIEKRNAIADKYRGSFKDLPLQVQSINQDTLSSYHLFTVTIKMASSVSKVNLFRHLETHGIVANCHYIPVHLQPVYRRLGFAEGDFPNSEQYYHQSLSLPIYPSLSEKEQDKVINAVKLYFS